MAPKENQLLARTLTILASRNFLRPGVSRVNPDAIVPSIITALPRATYAEAFSDSDGSFTALPYEMLPRLYGVDLAAEDPMVLAELVDIYSDYVSTKADGQVQSALNGDNRSMLVDAPTVRNGQKFRSARFVTDDPLGVLRLNQVRVNRIVSAARGANNMRVLSFQRQPELAPQINAMFAQGMRDVAALLAPTAEPAPALGDGTGSEPEA